MTTATPSSPSIELSVESTPYGRAFEFGDAKPFYPPIHQLIEPIWMCSLRIATKRPDLFAYIHKKTKALVIAVWVYPPGKPHPVGLMTELEVCEPMPDGSFVIPEKSYMVARCRPLEEQISGMLRRAEEAEIADKAALHENKHARKAGAKVMRRYGLEREARQVENYQVPYDVSDDTELV